MTWCRNLLRGALIPGFCIVAGLPAMAADVPEVKPHMVFMIGEDEYQTWETLPAFAARELDGRGIRTTIIHADTEDRNRFPGLVEALRDADLLVVSVRRRTPHPEVLEAIRQHLNRGRALVGIRTASHAFAVRGEKELEEVAKDPERDAWPEFDPEVLGGHYNNHYGNGPQTSVSLAEGAAGHPVLEGVEVESLASQGSLYRVSPLEPTATALLIGSIEGKPPEPVAWTHVYGPRQARVFYTSLGHPGDFENAAFRRLWLNALLWAAGKPVPPAGASVPGPEPGEGARWRAMPVPGTWEDKAGLQHDGHAWYRCLVRVPAGWIGASLTLDVEAVDNAHEAYFNGVLVGGAGSMPPNYVSGAEAGGEYPIPEEAIRVGEWNLVAIRVYDHEGRGGFKGAAPRLRRGNQAVHLAGAWQFRTGDDPAWAASTSAQAGGQALFHSVAPAGSEARTGQDSPVQPDPPLRPEEALASFSLPPDLELDLVLSEPVIAQPLQLSFDERGRLWVVEYRQYPAPAGLELVSHDEYWRAVYDKVPAAPPHHVPGRDRISIHEDTDGDGRYDRHKVYVEGLNIATSMARGRGGVWVLNPPHLLFYPDRDNDDAPDGDPEVHLSGFGLEDTHSVVNSLRWGPDGWLYAAQGSTVSARVRVHALASDGRLKADERPDTNRVHYSQGQNIWRYHPGRRVYEVFAEGGGNAFGVEVDAKGRIFSGHNGGDTRGFHYMQGAYLQKGFNKHGPLSNPHAFGYFPQMPHHAVERFTHTFLIYEAGALPARYAGRLFGVEPLQGRVVVSDIQALGSTFRTGDIERPVSTSDRWFKPVDIKVGPDGAVYIADWYDLQVNHWRNYQGNMDASNGRVYRLKAKGATPPGPVDLSRMSDAQLAGHLRHANPWHRETARRVLADRGGAVGAEVFQEMLAAAGGQVALEALWALYVARGPGAVEAHLEHPDPFVRLWAVRLLGDERMVSARASAVMARMASQEPDVEVRAQLACTAKRLPAAQALPMVRGLLARDEDAEDPRQPLLLWWALEAKAESDREAVLALLDDSTMWGWAMVEGTILERIMRRYAATGTRQNLATCAALIERAPTQRHRLRLMKGFEEAFKGRSLAGLPEDLVAALARHQLGSPAFQLRQGRPGALALALAAVSDAKGDPDARRSYIEILGEIRAAEAVPALLGLVREEKAAGVLKAALTALQSFDDASIGEAVAAAYPRLPETARSSALTLLTSRAEWAGWLLTSVEQGTIAGTEVARPLQVRLRGHPVEAIRARAVALWPDAGGADEAGLRERMASLSRTLREGNGNPYQGKVLFDQACAACHMLFEQGGRIGPDLTTYQRSDVANLLLSIAHPNAEIREGFETFQVETRDGRTLSGFIVEQDANVVVLRGLDGQDVALETGGVSSMKAAGLSLMPEGLLDGMEPQEVRDLFAYLRSSQPLP